MIEENINERAIPYDNKMDMNEIEKYQDLARDMKLCKTKIRIILVISDALGMVLGKFAAGKFASENLAVTKFGA